MPKTQITITATKKNWLKCLKRFAANLARPITNLPARYKTARFYMKFCGYDFRTAWRRAGMVI